jgi:chemotaxis protein MotA
LELKMGAVGLLVLFACVFGVYIFHGGDMAPIIAAAPFEFVSIFGAAVGAALIGNSKAGVGTGFAAVSKVFKGPKYHKEDYLAVILVVSKILKTLKAEGAVALEPHIENPESSAIFAEYPPILQDHALLDLICDTIRLMVVSSGNLSPYAVEDVMTASIKNHQHHEGMNVSFWSSMEGALPALGIVACVLGVVKTMGAIDQPPPILGALIGSALVGTFMGVLLAYGVAGPFAVRIGQVVEEDGEIFKCVQQLIVANLHGHPMPLVIEAARSVINHHNKPSFGEIFDGMRGK